MHAVLVTWDDIVKLLSNQDSSVLTFSVVMSDSPTDIPLMLVFATC